MSLVKVIEVIAQSDKSWEDATKEAIRIASRSVRNIRHVYVKEMQAIVENNEIVTYRLNVKISFLVEEEHLGQDI